MIFNSDSRVWQIKRYLIVALAFWGYFNIYGMRVNMSVAIVAMTDQDRTGEDTIFDWDSAEKGFVLSSFFYGYIATSFMGGLAATKFGGHIILALGVLVNAIGCILTPLAAMHLGVGGLIGIRVIQGIFQGLAYPSCHALFAKWSPDTEKSRMISLSICGSYFGTVIANLTAGSLAVQYGWASIFYTFGAIGLVWFILWVLIVRKSPQSDKWITQKEKDYIMNNISSNAYGNLKTPWKKLFTSVPVLAVTINHFCFNWGHYTFLTELPIYLKDALKFDLESTGFVASLPYITLSIGMASVGYVADVLFIRGYFSVVTIRKGYTCIAFILQSGLLILLAFTTDPSICVVIIVCAVTMEAFPSSAYLTNAIDISGRYAAMVIGLANTFATIPGVVSPMVAGLLVKNSTLDEWRLVFFIAAGVYITGAIIYGLLGTGDLQHWAKEPRDSIISVNYNKKYIDNKKLGENK